MNMHAEIWYILWRSTWSSLCHLAFGGRRRGGNTCARHFENKIYNISSETRFCSNLLFVISHKYIDNLGKYLRAPIFSSQLSTSISSESTKAAINSWSFSQWMPRYDRIYDGFTWTSLHCLWMGLFITMWPVPLIHNLEPVTINSSFAETRNMACFFSGVKLPDKGNCK